MSEESESMEDAIESVVRRVLYNEVSTFFPGIIKAVKTSPHNPNTKIVDVTSAFLRVDPETNTTKPRQIQSVPLVLPARTNTFMIRPPLDEKSLVGAYVGLIVSNSYLANWKKTGGSVLPTDGRKYHFADAVALMGYYPDLESWTTAPKENTAQIKVKPGTFLEIGNSKTDIPRLIADVMDIFSTAQSPSGTTGGLLVLSPSSISGKTLAQLVAEFSNLFNPDATP